MDTNLITKNESLFFIFYTLPTLFFLTVSLKGQVDNLKRSSKELRGLNITMVCLRATILLIASLILVYNIFNYFGIGAPDKFLDTMPYAVSTLLLLVSVTLWIQWDKYGKDT